MAIGEFEYDVHGNNISKPFTAEELAKIKAHFAVPTEKIYEISKYNHIAVTPDFDELEAYMKKVKQAQLETADLEAQVVEAVHKHNLAVFEEELNSD